MRRHRYDDVTMSGEGERERIVFSLARPSHIVIMRSSHPDLNTISLSLFLTFNNVTSRYFNRYVILTLYCKI